VRPTVSLVVVEKMLNLPNRFASTPVVVVVTLSKVVVDDSVVVMVGPVVGTASVVVA